jgi:hypothetical protein
MWIMIAIVAVTVVIGWREAPGLRKRGKARELFVFYLFLSIGAGLCIVQFALQLRLPSPLNLITFVFKPISQVMETLLQ